jgi:hypothetical protein
MTRTKQSKEWKPKIIVTTGEPHYEERLRNLRVAIGGLAEWWFLRDYEALYRQRNRDELGSQDKAFCDAMELVLNEFGRCDLHERIKHFEREGEHDEAVALDTAFGIVERWFWGETRYCEHLAENDRNDRLVPAS